jgi:flagellin
MSAFRSIGLEGTAYKAYADKTAVAAAATSGTPLTVYKKDAVTNEFTAASLLKTGAGATATYKLDGLDLTLTDAEAAKLYRASASGSTDYALLTADNLASSIATAPGTKVYERSVNTSTDAISYTEKTLVRTVTGGDTTYTLNGVDFDPATDLGSLFKTEAGGTTGQVDTLSTKIDASSGADTFDDVQDAASAYVTSLDKQRSLLGAYQNRLEYTLSNITALSTNLTASRSRVIDTDYASETADLTRNQILQQAATAMLAQANQMPNVILTLLK